MSDKAEKEAKEKLDKWIANICPDEKMCSGDFCDLNLTKSKGGSESENESK